MYKNTPANQLQKSVNVRIVTFLLFWCALVVVSGVYVTTPLIPVFMEDFQVSASTAAWSGSIFSLFYAIGFLLFGPLADRFGRKEIIVFGLSMLGLITILIGWIEGFVIFILLRGLQGLFASAFAPTAVAYVFEVFPREKRLQAISFISLGFVTAGIFGQIFAGILEQLWRWQTVFFYFGILYVISMIAVMRLLPLEETFKKPLNFHYWLKQVKEILSQKDFRLIYVITFMLLLAFIGMYTIIGDYLTASPFYLGDRDILYIRSAGLAGMLLSPFTGFFAKIIGLLRVLKCSLLLAISGLALLAVAGTNLPAVILMSVIHVAGISITFPPLMTLIGERSNGVRAIATSLYAFIMFAGATVGPLLSIAIAQRFTHALAFGALAFLLLIGLAASFGIEDRK